MYDAWSRTTTRWSPPARWSKPLANGVKQRDILRGKLHRISPLLDSLLGTWSDYASARKEELTIQAEHYRNEQDALQNDQRGGTQELMRLEREITGIQRWLGELSVLKHRFALVDDVKVLEQQLLAAKDAHDELAGALAQSRQFSAEDLEERLRDLEKRLKSVKQQLDHADNNSYARLREEFSQQDVERLMRLFNSALFSLPLGEHGITLDETAVVGQIHGADPRRLQGRALRSAGPVHRHLAHRAAGPASPG